MSEEYGSPRLRDKIVDIICDEWRKPDNDNEIAVATIFERLQLFERLQRSGVEASEQAVRDVLVQMANDGDIVLALPPNNLPTADTTVHPSRRELCE